MNPRVLPYLIDFPKVADNRGNLTFIEGSDHIPFDIQRIYYLYDVPGGESRAGHALKTTQQVLIAVAGSFDVVLDDGRGRHHTYPLNRSYFGIYVPTMTWRVIDNFSSGAVCLCLVSTPYDSEDYYRDYDSYLTALKIDA